MQLNSGGVLQPKTVIFWKLPIPRSNPFTPYARGSIWMVSDCGVIVFIGCSVMWCHAQFWHYVDWENVDPLRGLRLTPLDQIAWSPPKNHMTCHKMLSFKCVLAASL